MLGPEDGSEQNAKYLFRDKRPMLTAAPFFHAMGILTGFGSLAFQGTIVRLPSARLVSADLIIEAINAIKPASGIFPSSIIEDISSTEDGMKALKKLDFMFWGGAPLAVASGDKVCEVTNLVTGMGSTEAMVICTLLSNDPKEWNYFHWSAVSGATMEPVEGELYELVVKPKDKQYQAVFHTFPELKEWRTKDLFRRHPSKSHLWKYIGRRDDVIVLSNGEKFNPVETEKLIESHPLVKGALVVGQGKFQAGLLLESRLDHMGTQDVSALVKNVWPMVDEANREAPAHARIYRSRIAVASSHKPFVRTAKGSIIRLLTTATYKDEIDALYADEGPSARPYQKNIDGLEERKIRAVFAEVLPAFHDDTADDTDILSLGVDSLDVLALTNALNKVIEGVAVTTSTIYSNPSVKQLADVLSVKIKNTRQETPTPCTREEKLDKMVRKYTHELMRSTFVPASPQHPLMHTVVLTGSTGSLGSHILEQLLNNPSVDRVYCLNRSSDAATRQKSTFDTHHHSLTNFSKASFLHTDFSKEFFGLDESTYRRLQDSVTLFIHNAWAVNFNLTVESYEATHITGTRRAVDFCASSTHKPLIVFISSVASVGNWGSVASDGSAAPETITSLFDATLALPQGYGESKYVASQILAVASHRLGIRTAIVRPGQLAGPSTMSSGAAWNAHEWLPTLIHTSKILRKIPSTLGSMDCIDWVPMDVAAGTVLDIATSCATSEELAQVFHLTNPHTTAWSEVYPTIQAYYEELGLHIEAVEYAAWADELERFPQTKENAEKIPGLKLLDFYKSLRLQTLARLPAVKSKRTESVSRALREGGAVNEEMLRKWLQQWAF